MPKHLSITGTTMEDHCSQAVVKPKPQVTFSYCPILLLALFLQMLIPRALLNKYPFHSSLPQFASLENNLQLSFASLLETPQWYFGGSSDNDRFLSSHSPSPVMLSLCLQMQQTLTDIFANSSGFVH